MGNSCRITKTCCVCLQTLHNLEFQSNEKGRIDIKRFCKNCKPIYAGIRKGIFEESLYVGKNFNHSILHSSSDAISVLDENEKKKEFEVSLEEAVELIKKGGAHVISSQEIQLIRPIDFYHQEWNKKQHAANKKLIPLNLKVDKLSKTAFISLLNKEGDIIELIDFEDAKILISQQKATIINKITVQLLYPKKEIVLSHYKEAIAI